MAINNLSGTISVTGAETAANLRTYLTANTTQGTYSGKRFTLNSTLSISASATLTMEDYSVLELSSTGKLVLDPAGTLAMGNDSELRFSGTAKSHSAVKGTISGTRLKYIINTPTGGSINRNDFAFDGAVFTGDGWLIVADDYNITDTYLHGETALQGLTNVKIVNSKTGGAFIIQFNARNYFGVVMPVVPNGATQTLYMPRSQSGEGVLVAPIFPQTGTIVTSSGNSTTGRCVLLDPKYPNITGTPSLQRIGLSSTVGAGNSLREIFSFRADNYANQASPVSIAVWNRTAASQTYNTTFTTGNTYAHPSGFTAVQMINRDITTTTVNNTRAAFDICMRRADINEYVLSNTSGVAVVEAATPVVNSMFSGTVAEAEALTGIAFSVSAGAVTITITRAVTTQDIYNKWCSWVSQPAQMAGATPVPSNLISILNKTLNITGSITTSENISGGGNATNGITATGTAATSGSGSYGTLAVSDSTANSQVTIVGVTLDANTKLFVSTNGGTSYTELTSTTYKYNSGSASVIFKLTKGTLTQTDSYTLASGLTNTFTSFTNDVGVLLQATETNILAVIPSASAIKTEVESTTILAKKADTDAIKTKTDNIPASPATAGELDKVVKMVTVDATDSTKNKFTTTALSNAPTGSGGSGGITADQTKQLLELHRTQVAVSYVTTTAIAEGATEIPIANTYDADYFAGHYVVINNGTNPIQRSVTSHINTMTPIPKSALVLNGAIPALPIGTTIMILIRTTTQDGANLENVETTVNAGTNKIIKSL